MKRICIAAFLAKDVAYLPFTWLFFPLQYSFKGRTFEWTNTRMDGWLDGWTCKWKAMLLNCIFSLEKLNKFA